MDLAFRPVTRADLPLVRTWRAAPHVARWWGDDHSPAQLEAEYGPAIDGDEPTELFIAELAGRPFAFLQRYLLADYPEWIKAMQVAGDFSDAAGLDYLIGAVGDTGHGLGTTTVGAFADATLTRYGSASSLVTDVDQRNVASWRCLEKNGFTRVWAGTLEVDDPMATQPCYVYTRRR